MKKDAETKKHRINPKGTETAYESMQFSQAVRVGKMVWVSGQVGMDDSFHIAEGTTAQTRLAFKNLEHVIHEAGGTLADIVELVTYHTSMGDLNEFLKVKAEFIREDYPAWTAVGVPELALPGLHIEIRATAVLGSGDMIE